MRRVYTCKEGDVKRTMEMIRAIRSSVKR